MPFENTIARAGGASLATNKVMKNTFTLLSASLLFSAFTAWLSMRMNWPPLGLVVTLVGFYGLLFLTEKLANSAWGLAAVFALTGFMGLTIGPIINAYTQMFSNGAELVMLAMGGTGVITLGLAGYAMTTRKDFSFMSGFLVVGVMVAFLAGIGAAIFQIPALSLAVSAAFVLLMSGMILYQVSELVHGGETNYIRATVGLFVSIYNLFLSLLQLLGALAGED